MPYRKKTTKKPRRKTFRKRTVRRALTMGRVANRRYDIHYFTRYLASPQSFLGNEITGNPLFSSFSFGLNQVINPADFSLLFDQYMITHIQVKFFLQTAPEAQTPFSAVYPKLYWVVDHDDAQAFTNLNSLREHHKSKVAVLLPNRPITVNIKPAVAVEVWRGGVTPGYAPKWRTWLDFNNTDVPHYGLKIAIDNFTSPNYIVATETKFWFACKGTR